MTSRRTFLRDAGLALASLGFTQSLVARAAAVSPERSKLLIVIFQRGAVDGLNMVVPYGERTYYRSRPTIAVARPGGADSAIDLDGFFGLHPRLAPLQPIYARRELAIIHACGSPDHTRSHFDAQDYMESGTPGVKSTDDGWLNRTLGAMRVEHGSPLRAVALTPTLPRALHGSVPALAIGQLAQSGLDERCSGVSASAGYPASTFGQALRRIAQLARCRVGLQVAFAETSHWDHHVNEGSTQGPLAARLDDFARAIAALVTDLGEQMGDTVILTMSEFGRTLAENSKGGTDHGHGNVMMAIGAGVEGGRVYCDWPGLERDQLFEGRDLHVTTDFRDVFADVVTNHLGVGDPSRIFPGYAIRAEHRRGFMRRA